jgi:hypothetical protein
VAEVIPGSRIKGGWRREDLEEATDAGNSITINATYFDENAMERFIPSTRISQVFDSPGAIRLV